MALLGLSRAKEYAIHCHSSTNHMYGDNEPYETHLQMVVGIAKIFLHMIPEADRGNVIDACWCHDVIEDCRQTYNDVLRVTGSKDTAEMAYALTNEKGKNRQERANNKYYEGIRKTKHATFVKLCDRIANIQYSKATKSNMFEMYRKENESFVGHLYDPTYKEMFNYLNELLK